MRAVVRLILIVALVTLVAYFPAVTVEKPYWSRKYFSCHICLNRDLPRLSRTCFSMKGGTEPGRAEATIIRSEYRAEEPES